MSVNYEPAKTRYHVCSWGTVTIYTSGKEYSVNFVEQCDEVCLYLYHLVEEAKVEPKDKNMYEKDDDEI